MTDGDEPGRFGAVGLKTADTVRLAAQRPGRQAEAAPWDPSNLLNLTHDSIFVGDMKGIVKYWNRAAEELYGWNAEQALGKNAYELLKAVFPAPREQIEQELLRAGRWEGEIVHTRKDGGQIVVASRWSLQRNETGAPIAILTTNNDITERKRAEQAREDIEEQWRATFESNPTMYFIVDVAGTIVSANAFGAAQLGFQADELLGHDVLQLFHEADRAFVRSRANACLEAPGRMMRWEARKIRKDGTLMWVRETANAVVLKGRPVLLVVCEDITEQKCAEDAARQSAQEIRDIIETIPTLAWMTLPDGANAFVNMRWTEYTGLSSQETEGSGWQIAVHPEDVEQHVRKWHESVATGEPFYDEARFRRAADGEYRWFLVRGVPHRDEQGKILKWFGILTDIEDRKRSEALLAGEKRILEMVAKGDTLPRILDALCLLVEDQARGALASVLLIEDGRLKHGGAPSLPRDYVEAIDGVAIGPSVGSCGTAAYFGRQVIVSDIANDPLWIDYRAAALPHSLRACWSTPIMSPDEKAIGTFAMYYRETRSPSLRDQDIIEQITDLAGVAIQRKLTEERLQRSETYLAEAQRLTRTGSWAWSRAAGKMVYWSAETFRIFGMDPQQGLPSRLKFWQYIHPDDRTRIYEHVRTSVDQKLDFIVDGKLVRPDGTVTHVQVLGHPVTGAAGETGEYVGTIVDLTERRRAEEALRASGEQLERTRAELARVSRVMTLGQLTASIAHEISQPITAARNNASAATRFLDRNPPDLKEVHEALDRIVSNTARAGNILGRIRDHIKSTPPRKEQLDINAAINEVIALMRNEAVMNGVSIRASLTAGLPPIEGDYVQLQQVVLNLVLNAIEAMSTGGDAIRELSISSGRDPTGGVLVTVCDSGPGIDPDSVEHLFQSFYTTKASGMGMGLSICRTIVDAHGGRVWAERNEPRGSVLKFTVPAEEIGS